jgi:hypothetical protein
MTVAYAQDAQPSLRNTQKILRTSFQNVICPHRAIEEAQASGKFGHRGARYVCLPSPRALDFLELFATAPEIG